MLQKLNVSIFKFKNKIFEAQITLNINNEIIHKVSHAKFLGVIIDENLKQVIKSTGIITKIRHYTNLNTLKLIYYALVYPYI
jgi:hypothetical protein